MNKKEKRPGEVTRRDFLKTSAAVAGATLLSDAGARLAFGQGSDKIRVGLVGCGGRGIGAVCDCVASSPGIEVVALADVVKAQVDRARQTLKSLDKEPAPPATGQATSRPAKDRIMKVDDDHCFAGLDAYKKLISSGVDLVILTTAPGFRPMHLRACVEAGKHVFMEKPVAVDPVGVRHVIESARMAREKRLGIVSGTIRRRQPNIMETVKRVHDGQIGEIVGGQCYFLTGPVWVRPNNPSLGLSEFEWQCFNWYYWDWLSGDHIVEQHVHEIDVIHWVMKGPPEKIMGMGGRASRGDDKNTGMIYDHFAVEFEWPGGVRVESMCRQTPGTYGRVNAYITGAKGKAYCYDGKIVGEKPFDYRGENPNPYVLEHADLIKSIRDGKPLNEGEQIALSSLMAIGGRMSAYTGRELSWNWLLKSSKLDIFPKDIKPGPGIFPPVSVPGKMELI